MSKLVVYDKESDTLHIRNSDAKTVEFLHVGSCILEFDKYKHVIGVEFLDFQKESQMNTDYLENFENCTFEAEYKNKKLHLLVIFPDQEKEFIMPFSSELNAFVSA